MRGAFSHIRMLAALILAGAALLSCGKEEPGHTDTPEERHDVVNAWLSMDLKVVSSGATTRSVSDNVSGGTNDGIDENAITSLAVYLVPAEDGVEDWDECIMTYVPRHLLPSGSTYKASVTARLNVPMNVYVGANLSPSLAGKVLESGREASYKSASESYPDLMQEFVTAEDGVAMFCTQAYQVTFSDDNTDPSNPAEVSGGGTVDLVRMVAKVHMLFQCYGSHDGYVQITEPGSLTPAAFGAFGWSKLEDISYIVNTVNRSTRLYQPAYGGYTSYMDMNHSMADLLDKGLEWEYVSGAEDEFAVFDEDWIVTYDDEWDSWSAKPEKYVADRAPFGSCQPYVKGLYCLENTTDDSALPYMTDDERKSVPFMVATHVIVKARFVPRYINIVDAGELVTVDYGENGYDAALNSLAETTGVDENGDSKTYPAGTFFTRDMKEFYDYDGMMKMIELQTIPGLSRKNFAAYPAGFGFYYSYIHGGTDSSTGKVTFNGEDSGIYRNHYHILNCQLMKVPATPGSFNQLMMVNSKVVDWNPKGGQDLVVKPNV